MANNENNQQESSYIELNSLKRANGKITPLGYNTEKDNNKDSNKQLQNEYDAEYILKNSNSLIWRILRLALQITILVTFIALIAFIVAVIIIHPGCEKAPELEWWENSLIYRVDLEKFKNFETSETLFKVLSNNMKYFENNKVDAIWLSNIVDLNFDFTTIYASHGTLDEFKDLVKELHEKNIKIILDFIPNYTTDKSEWFLKSKNNDPNYKDYYIWSDTANNWNSLNGLSAWFLSDNGKFYYHKYEVNQPDLNYRNPKVVEELHNALKYWLSTDIDGFNLVGSSYLFEDYLLRNEVISNEYTQHQRETFYLIAEIKDLLNEYKTNTSREIVLMNGGLATEEPTNSLNDSIIKKYFGNKNLGGFDLVAFKKLFKQDYPNTNVNGDVFIKTIDEVLKKYEDMNKSPLWILDETNMLFNASQPLVNLLQGSLVFLPGTAIIQLHKDIYESFIIKNNTDESIGVLIRRAAGIRRDSDSLKYSKMKYNKNENNNCGITEFVKYYDGEYSFSIHFDIEDSSNCKNEKIKLKSNLIKDNSINVKYINTQYSENTNLIKTIKADDKVEFNAKGETSIDIPRHAFIVCSWPFQPPDINEIL